MKKLFTLLAAILFTASAFSQPPYKLSYQAVIRDTNNTLVINSSVGLKISILQGALNGTAVYVETQTSTTNLNGLATMEIGSGTVVLGNFTIIDWPKGTYFIKTEIDPTGGMNYLITGTSELLSVPYALHAKTAENVSGGIIETDSIFGLSIAAGITATDTATWNNKLDSFIETDPIFGTSVAAGIAAADTTIWNHKQGPLIAGAGIDITGNVIGTTGVSGPFYPGQDTLDGIVYYIYIGGDGKQHGLIVSKIESIAQWQSTFSLVNANRTEDGTYNTGLMTNSPAASYVTSLGPDWYLPSIDELSLLYYNRFIANKALRAGGFTLLANTAEYWSSTELDMETYAYFFHFTQGYQAGNHKSQAIYVRAVRAF